MIVLSDKPCKNCGSFERYDSAQHKCVQCHREKGNVWVISWRANNLKRDATLDELKLLVSGLENVRRARLLSKFRRVV